MDKGYLRSLLTGLTGSRQLIQAVEHIADTWKLGPPEHQERGLNAQWYFLTSTSVAESTSEFSIQHGLATPPKFAVPILNLSHVGSQCGPYTVTRAADNRRIYLRSSDTSVPLWFLVEA